jgi:hypothetical protein
MLNFKIYNSSNLITNDTKTELIEFLHKHLEQFCDEKKLLTRPLHMLLNEIPVPEDL